MKITSSKKETEMIIKIANRAKEMNLLEDDRIALMMDLEVALEEFDLDLAKLLDADDFNFTHDIVGIQHNLDRSNEKFINCFVPRYAKK